MINIKIIFKHIGYILNLLILEIFNIYLIFNKLNNKLFNLLKIEYMLKIIYIYIKIIYV